ncbi:hypothetical protein ACLK1T_25070 [Escherichia coli]
MAYALGVGFLPALAHNTAISFSRFYRYVSPQRAAAPIARLGDWTFDEQDVESSGYDPRSVPGYSNIISMIGMLAERFVSTCTQVHHIGLFLGAATLSVRATFIMIIAKLLRSTSSRQ